MFAASGLAERSRSQLAVATTEKIKRTIWEYKAPAFAQPRKCALYDPRPKVQSPCPIYSTIVVEFDGRVRKGEERVLERSARLHRLSPGGETGSDACNGSRLELHPDLSPTNTLNAFNEPRDVPNLGQLIVSAIGFPPRGRR